MGRLSRTEQELVALGAAMGSNCVPETAWMDEPVSARYDGTTPLSMVPRRQYDAILLIESVTPWVMLH